LITIVSTLVDRLNVVATLVVLQTKGSLVTLRHFNAILIDDVEMSKHLHAVIVPGRERGRVSG